MRCLGNQLSQARRFMTSPKSRDRSAPVPSSPWLRTQGPYLMRASLCGEMAHMSQIILSEEYCVRKGEKSHIFNLCDSAKRSAPFHSISVLSHPLAPPARPPRL